jgi:nucleoside-diphosphate-sugar epimerase
MEKYNLPICIIRPTTIYGLNEQPQHLIPTILRSCFKGEKMDFVKDAVHDYIFVEDVVEGILNLSEHSARGIYELGTGVQTSNQQILELIENITNKKANINIVSSMRDYDNLNWVSTNFRARSWGWLPKITLRQGLERVVEDYIKNPKSYDK